MKKAEEKEERRKAREQDKNFVEYRKDQILRDIRPTNKGFNMKKFDESFPEKRRPARQNTQMEFGELMHKYLTLRPDGRFATWQGKLKTKKSLAQGKADALKKVVTGGKNAGGKDQSKRAQKNYNKALQNNLRLVDEVEEDDVDQKRLKEAAEFLCKDDVEAKNKYLLNAIVDNKPFWLIGDPLVPEEEEEEEVVDAKMLSEFMAKRLPVKSNPSERKSFHTWGPTPQLWNELKFFNDKKLVIGNTLESITASRARDNPDRKNNFTKAEVTWNPKTKLVDYVMDSIPIEKTAIYGGALGDFTRKKGAAE
ncbi:unnamed protein product [Caenorhabditis angaria]|uniref:Uncharacterized protein n=1 Tax=Caenorhabditis angaria TaxID=860376 RepID=A0A9P1N1C2_9PELO|nr:unnamed protein product [Caenorhabditis angaria]